MQTIEKLLAHARKSRAGELLIMAGDVPAIRVSDAWVRLAHERCTPAEVEGTARGMMSAEQWGQLQEGREVEFDFTRGEPVRVNVHFQRSSLVILARLAAASAA